MKSNLGFIIFDIVAGAVLTLLANYNMVWSSVGFILLFIIQIRRLFHREKLTLGSDYSIIGFNFFFFLMFALCTYITPILVIIGIESEVKEINFVDYNSKFIPYSLYLCTIAISFYTSGFLRGLDRISKQIEPRPIQSFKSILFICNILATIITAYFLYCFFEARRAGEMDVAGSVTTLVDCFIILPLALCGYMNQFYKYSLFRFVKEYWYILTNTLLISISMMSIGDRLIAVCLMTSLAFIINKYVYRFSKLQMILALTIGFFLMFLISFTRGRTSLLEGVANYREADDQMAMFQDVYPANTCLILGTEARDLYGLYKPMKIIPTILSPIPFVPSIIKDSFFDGDYASAMYITRFYRSRAGIGDSGMGSHAVADIYVSWGVIGVVFFFYLIGLLVGKFYRGKTNIYCLIAYIGFVAWSVYMPRQSIFDPYRDIVWMILIYSILTQVNKTINS